MHANCRIFQLLNSTVRDLCRQFLHNFHASRLNFHPETRQICNPRSATRGSKEQPRIRVSRPTRAKTCAGSVTCAEITWIFRRIQSLRLRETQKLQMHKCRRTNGDRAMQCGGLRSQWSFPAILRFVVWLETCLQKSARGKHTIKLQITRFPLSGGWPCLT